MFLNGPESSRVFVLGVDEFDEQKRDEMISSKQTFTGSRGIYTQPANTPSERICVAVVILCLFVAVLHMSLFPGHFVSKY